MVLTLESGVSSHIGVGFSQTEKQIFRHSNSAGEEVGNYNISVSKSTAEAAINTSKEVNEKA